MYRRSENKIGFGLRSDEFLKWQYRAGRIEN